MLDVLPDLLTRHRLARPLALATNLALLVLLLSVLAQATWFALSLGAPALPAAAVRAPPATAKPVDSLATWHLFGNALPLADPRLQAQNAPATSLRLTLRGVFAGADPRSGRAIVADESGVENNYRVGDELPGGARLEAVYPDRVSLARGAVLESLQLPPQGAGNAGDLRAPAAAAARAPLPGATRSGVAAPTPFVNPNIATNPVAWNQATQKLELDPATLARDIQALPVLENGKFVGVRLSGGKDAALLGKFGLQPDDVVTAVNGIQLDDPSRGAEVAASLKSAQSATVTVRRNGKPVNLSVSLH